MNKTLKWKLVLLFFLVLFSGTALLPSFVSNVPDWWRTYLAPGNLKLGLDLQGGMHLVLRVDLDKAIEDSLDFAASDLKEALAEKKITVVRTAGTDPKKVVFALPNTSALETVKQTINEDFPNLDITVDSSPGSFPKITLRLGQERIDEIKKSAVNQALEVIRNRIDQFGVAEPVIVRQGANEIVVQLPGIKDPERAMKLIGQTAQLEFKLVADTEGIDLWKLVNQALQSGQWSWGQNIKVLNRALQNQLPPGTEIYFESNINKETGQEVKTPLLVQSQVMMTGDMVKDAQVRIGGTFNEPLVSLDLTGRGSKIFAKVTSENVGRRFAIILDEVVKSAPVIREKILGGSAQITGNFTYEEASDLAIVLRVGALPAPVQIIQNLTVGASLGQDSINKGLMSGLLGTALVIIFMIIYYRLSGIIANIGLFLNILFLFSGLAALQATLTLPGIAGIILSIGMAVDSNVLIFERMREEFALGKSVKSGVEGGYDKAFWTIVDSQVTTLITAFALFLFGTGPIKGFAVTLSLGVTFNLFTTLFATRLAYDILYAKNKLKPLKFLEFIKKQNIDFMKIKNFAFGFSGFLVLIGLIAFLQVLRGQANLGIDFTGGSMLQYTSSSPFSLDEVRKTFKGSGLEDVDLQQVTSENRLIVRLKQSSETVGHLADKISSVLKEKFPDHNFVLDSEAEIGSSISDVLRDKALEAIAISLAGVIIYLALRFDIRFGVAAAIATFHDVLAVLGVCWLLDKEINLLIITALLTIAGYSLNDTVVIFDRIRETLQKKREQFELNEVINISINEVLSRSVVTSLTTLLTVTALYFFGGSVIHDFSFALMMGIVIGTYSSVFVAGSLLTVMRKKTVRA